MEFNATFLVTAVSFVLFTIIMNAIFYKPIQKIVEDRQTFLDETNEEAKLHAKRAESIERDRVQKLEKTKVDAKKIISEKTDDAKSKKSEMAADASHKASQKIEGAKENLSKAKNEAQDVLADGVVNLAQGISSKFLGSCDSIECIDRNLISEVMKISHD